MTARDRNLQLLMLVVLACVGWQYRETFGSIVQKWQGDSAFSHGVLILPVSLWLVWRKRRRWRRRRRRRHGGVSR